MIHIRVDNHPENSRRRFACGLGPDLPEGDTYWFESEASADRADCPGCNPGGPRRLGTPISQLSGRPGEPGFERFKDIARSWGYD
jgi:hypothetical protein